MSCQNCSDGLFRAQAVSVEAERDQLRSRVFELESQVCSCDVNDEHRACGVHGFCHLCEVEEYQRNISALEELAERSEIKLAGADRLKKRLEKTCETLTNPLNRTREELVDFARAVKKILTEQSGGDRH